MNDVSCYKLRQPTIHEPVEGLQCMGGTGGRDRRCAASLGLLLDLWLMSRGGRGLPVRLQGAQEQPSSLCAFLYSQICFSPL